MLFVTKRWSHGSSLALALSIRVQIVTDAQTHGANLTCLSLFPSSHSGISNWRKTILKSPFIYIIQYLHESLTIIGSVRVSVRHII